MEYTQREDGDVVPLRPASGDILKEFCEIREGGGVSARAILDKAPLIQALPVVEDHRLYKQWPESDRHIAAFGAIGCVLKHSIPDYMTKTILVLTMRYDAAHIGYKIPRGWDSSLGRDSFPQRSKLIQALLFYSDKRFKKLLNDGYTDLADLMVFLDETPCRIPDAKRVSDAVQRFHLEQIVGMYMAEYQGPLREMLAEAGIGQIRAQLLQEGGTASMRFETAVRHVLAYEYDRAIPKWEAMSRRYIASRMLEIPKESRRRVPRYTLSAGTLEGLMFSHQDMPFLDRLAMVPAVAAVVPPRPERPEDWSNEPAGTRIYFAHRLADSLLLLAALLKDPHRIPAETQPERAPVRRIETTDTAADAEFNTD